MKIFNQTVAPKRVKDEFGYLSNYSEDVITFDGNGMLNIAWYDYQDKEWRFHIDVELEPGEQPEFAWMYKPSQLALGETLKTVFSNKLA